MADISTIGFDADDTLWHNEKFYKLTQARFREFLGRLCRGGSSGCAAAGAERKNLAHYGFGIKGFTLSMIETALEVTEGRVPGRVIGDILEAGREMLAHPVELLPGVREVVESFRGVFGLVLITKGDLFDQERKLAASGLGELFDGVEIVSDKTCATYRDVFARHGAGAEAAVMVGNSMKSDVVPAIEAGAWACMCRTSWSGTSRRRPRRWGIRGFARFRISGSCRGWCAGCCEAECAFRAWGFSPHPRPGPGTGPGGARVCSGCVCGGPWLGLRRPIRGSAGREPMRVAGPRQGQARWRGGLRPP